MVKHSSSGTTLRDEESAANNSKYLNRNGVEFCDFMINKTNEVLQERKSNVRKTRLFLNLFPIVDSHKDNSIE